MKKLNLKYRKKDEITDVLTFVSDYKNLVELIGYYMLGDIYLNLRQIKINSKNNNRTFKNELIYTFCHGLGHMIGYNHNSDSNEIKMELFIDKIIKEIRCEKHEIN